MTLNAGGGTFQTAASTTLTATGAIDGSGGLTKAGAGTLILSGTNSYTGGTTVSGGVLQGNSASLQGNILNDAVVVFSQATDGTYAGAMSGSGALTKTGIGTLTLTGANNYAGGTVVSGGILQGTTSSLQGDILNNAAVIFDQGSDGTYAGAMSGSGSLAKSGTGSVVLSGANSYTGGTVVNGGFLELAFGASLASEGALTINGGTFDLNSNNQTVGALSGTGGTIELDSGTLTTNSTASTTFAGSIGGAGNLVKEGSGTLTLTGTSNYTGETTISAGTLALSGGASILGSSLVTVNGTFDISNNFDTAITSLAGTGSVVRGSNGLYLSNASTTFAGVIGGSGNVVVQGGTQTLSGASTFTGAALIVGGATLALSGSGSIAAAQVVGSNDTGSGPAIFDISQTTSGATVTALYDTAGNVVVRLGARTLTISEGQVPFAGVIEDGGIGGGTGGGVTLAAGARLDLTAASTYSGATTLGAGATLSLSGAGRIDQTSGVSLADGAVLNLASTNNERTIGGLDGAATSTVFLNQEYSLTLGSNSSANFAGTFLGGAGGLVKQGSGTQTLSGSSIYSGTTLVTGGTLQAGATRAFAGSSAFTVASGAALDLNGFNQTIGSLAGEGTVSLGNATLTSGNASDTTFSGVISGAGNLVKEGSGTLTLEGFNDYTGTTTVNTGTLALGPGGAIMGSSLLTIGSGATFDISGNPGFSAVNRLAGSGAVELGGNGLAILAAADTFSGTIAGSGGLEIVSGTQTLRGQSTYSNATQIDAGATLALAGTGSIATSGVVIFAPLGPGSATFDISQTTAGASVGALFDSAGVGVIRLGGQTLTITSGSSFNGVIADGGLGGGAGGGLAIAGGASQSLGGINTYTGGTDINGTLALTGSGSIAASSGVGLVGGSASLDISGVAGGTTIQGLSGEVGSTVQLGANRLTVGAANSTVFAGTITDGGAGGALTKAGTGTLTLTGTNSYTGGTLVSAGILQGNSASLQGSIENNAAVIFDQATGGTYAGAMGGTGSFTKTGAGTLILTGNNSYTGGTTVSAGTLQGNRTSLQGNIVNNATLVFEQTGVGGPYTGNLSGTGVLVKTGASTLELTGATVAQSLITVSQGALLVGAFTSVQSNIVNNGSVLFQTSTAVDQIYAGNMSGTGSLEKSLSGTLILTGTNSYSGGTVVNGGILRGSAASLQGNIVNNAAVIFEQLQNGTYAGNMTGTGTLAKAGAGTLILTGTSAVGGGTSVNAGLLVVNGSLTGGVAVGPGAMLGGSGQIVGPFTANGGTLMPGNSIGTLNVNGSFTQNGGVYQVEVNAQGQSDRIVVTGAPGTATINGGTVQVLAEQGTYARNTTYTILTANGGVSGAYSNVISNFAFLTPSLSYDSNNVLLTLAQSSSAFASGAQTPNQFAVGTALDLASPTATGDFNTVLNALASLNTVQGPAALTAISGQNYAGFSNGLVQTGQLFMSNFSAQAGGANRVGHPNTASRSTRVEMTEACGVACEPAAAGIWGVWGGAIGATGSLGGNANAGTLTYNVGGFAGGLDRQITPEILLGFTLGYSSGNQWTSGFSGRGTTDTVQAGLYAGYLKGPVYVDALVGYAYSNNQMQRSIVIPGLAARVASGSAGANQFFGQVETGYRLDIGSVADAYVTPFVRLQGSTAMQNGFTESGANSLNLTIASQTTSSLRTVIGAQAGGAVDLGWREKLAAQFKLGWAHEFASTDRPVTAAFAGAPAIPFTTFGSAPNRDGIVVGFNATTAIAERTSIYLRYEAQVSGSDNMQSGTVGLRMTW